MNLQTLRTAASDLWHNGWAAVHNLRRRFFPADADYVVLSLYGQLPEYIPPPPRWQQWLPFEVPGRHAGPSLGWFRHALDQIADDPRPLGVVLHLDGLDIGWAQAQSVRGAMARFRARGKQVIAYAQSYDFISYFAAAAADKVLAPPPGRWYVTGLRSEVTFLKDTLAAYGIQPEVINVSPYKTAGDMFARSDISPEHHAMLSWILDGQYEFLIGAIAGDRKLEPARVRELIDNAPLTAQAACENGLLDAVLYEDDLAQHLAPPRRRRPKARRSPFRRPSADEPSKPKARLKRWGAVADALIRPIRWRSGRYIAVILLEGTIVPGRNNKIPAPVPLPFLGSEFAGAESIAQHLRHVEHDDETAAIVLYVNSRGGAAAAADLIWREVERVRRKKPVVVCMGDYAASGGYYVSANANWIVAQPLTITGSIGVIALKLVTAGLYDKFNARRVVLQRGQRAGLFGDDSPYTPELRAVVQSDVDAYYADFKRVVLEGRSIAESAFDSVAGGRVWLGQQALERKLVDEFGDLHAAIEKAKSLANLPAGRWTPTAWYTGPGGHQLPAPFSASLAWQAFDFISALSSLLGERVWMIDPLAIKIKC